MQCDYTICSQYSKMTKQHIYQRNSTTSVRLTHAPLNYFRLSAVRTIYGYLSLTALFDVMLIFLTVLTPCSYLVAMFLGSFYHFVYCKQKRAWGYQI